LIQDSLFLYQECWNLVKEFLYLFSEVHNFSKY